MDQHVQSSHAALYRLARLDFIMIAAALAALVLLFHNTFPYLYGVWHREEYSHGFLIPLVTAYLLWQRRQQLAQVEWHGSWAGVVIAVLGVAIFFIGVVASITTVDTYALVIVLLGVALTVMGQEAFRIALLPLALLFLMNPIPNFFYYNLSAELQLIASQLGVAFMRGFGVSVFLEGNVIDLGNYKLQVAEACSGLRYLFPLMTLGVITACLFKGPTWLRWYVFLSSIPVTVLMNGFRVGVIGVLVDRLGIAQAEGFLHYFEGWVIFMTCFLVLLAECWGLMRLTGERRSLTSMFALELPQPRTFTSGCSGSRAIGKPAAVLLLILLAAVLPARALPKRIEVQPPRADFTHFPLQLEGWQGRRQVLDTPYIEWLKMDDYLLVNFARSVTEGHVSGATAPVNLYIAYYASQRTGQAVHSPRGCLPGGGWRILDFSQHELKGVGSSGTALRVNRVMVQHGSDRQLVYYWFQERGRDITNEWLVKWYLLQDALLRNRTDGALVRLITPLTANDREATADARLSKFAANVLPTLQSYLPN